MFLLYFIFLFKSNLYTYILLFNKKLLRAWILSTINISARKHLPNLSLVFSHFKKILSVSLGNATLYRLFHWGTRRSIVCFYWRTWRSIVPFTGECDALSSVSLGSVKLYRPVHWGVWRSIVRFIGERGALSSVSLENVALYRPFHRGTQRSIFRFTGERDALSFASPGNAMLYRPFHRLPKTSPGWQSNLL